MTTHLIVFTRYPIPGSTKTRLIPALGEQNAALLQQRLTSQTLAIAKQFAEKTQAVVQVRFAGANAQAMRSLFGDDVEYISQLGEDLGDRLTSAIQSAFQAGATRVLVIGADCPELDASLLETASESLRNHNVVVGPAEDGGYYLIGMTSPRPTLFQDIPWSTSNVLSATLERAYQLRLRIKQLKTLADVDYPEDLIPCRNRAELSQGIFPDLIPGRLSIVIPTMNEAKRLPHAIQSIQAHSTDPSNLQVIVADGGSEDDTVQRALELGATVVSASPGRGIQMNAGASIASGENLLFLHADAILPERFDEIIRTMLEQPFVAGAFQLKIDHDTHQLRLVAHLANLRSKWLERPYGDQGIFLPAKTFFQLGGFRNWPLMEDFELAQRLRKLGRIGLAEVPVTVSARRWQRRGVVRTTLLNQIIVAAWRMGVSPDRLARWYRQNPS